MSRFKDLTGQRFGRLIAIEPAFRNIAGAYHWFCRCDCGELVTIPGVGLRFGTKSCGCLQKERARTQGFANVKHGCNRRLAPHAPEYHIYYAAKARCQSPENPAFENYGGRGIEFRFTSFEQFISSIGFRPSRRLTLDRIDNDGHYEPGNVRWASRSKQRLNSRRPKSGWWTKRESHRLSLEV